MRRGDTGHTVWMGWGPSAGMVYSSIASLFGSLAHMPAEGFSAVLSPEVWLGLAQKSLSQAVG